MFKTLGVDCFYDHWQRVKDPECLIFQLFSEECQNIVKARIVRASMTLSMTYEKPIGRKRETRTAIDVDVKSVIDQFTQLKCVEEKKQKEFYHILYDRFESKWEIKEE
jgi:hypothetical protein